MKKLDNLIISTKTKANMMVDDAIESIKTKKAGESDLIGKIVIIFVIILVILALGKALTYIIFGNSDYESGAPGADSFMGKLSSKILGIFN
jgi:hypothetical protein